MPDNQKNTVHLTIVTPYSDFFKGEVTSVVINTIDGLMGFIPGHPPLIVALSPGMSHLVQDGQYRYFTISEGYCEVTEEEIKIVCNAAEYPEDLSPRRTCKSFTEAVKNLEKAKKIEDRAARNVLVKEHEQAMARARARRHLLELHGSDHQKERIAVLVKEYGWKEPF